MVTDGVTVAVPWAGEHGLQREFPDASVSVKAVAVPAVICQLRVEFCPAAIVPGEAVRLRLKGTVIVRVCGPAAPPGPVAVREYLVVVPTGTVAEPDVGSGPVSSPTGMAGLIVIDVALVVAHVSVTLWPLLTSVGLAVNWVICGGALTVGATFAFELPHDAEP